MSHYGYDQSNRKKNQVTESMISTVSEAFEFEDFLGEKTTLKDRVPKNKGNLEKKIVHFSREVVEDRGFASNSLSSYNTNAGFQKTNAFENYMSDDFFNKLRQQESSGRPQEVSQPYQLPPYSPPQSSQYQPPKYTDYSSNYSYTPSTSSPYSSSSINPQYKSSYESSYSSSKYTSSYGSEYPKSESQRRIQSRPATQNIYTKTQNNYGYSEPRSPNVNYQNYSSKQPINFTTSSGADDRNNWAPKPTTGSSGNPFANTSYSNTYSSNPYPSTTYTPKSYQPLAYQQNKFADRSYSSYGEYSNDFSSPQIMEILNKRRKL